MPLFLDDFDAHVFAVTVGAIFLLCLWFFVRWRALKAKQAVIREWDSWAARNPEEAKTILGGRRFFQYLQQERPDLLNFRGFYEGFDKGRVVHKWLLSEGRVKD